MSGVRNKKFDIAVIPEVESALQRRGKKAGRVLAQLGFATSVSRQKAGESDVAFVRRKQAFDEARDTIREAVRRNPATALAVVAESQSETGLTLIGKARALDEIIGQVGDDSKAVEMIDSQIMPSEQHKLLVVRGDLPSSFAELATPDQVIQAALANVAEIGSSDMMTTAFELQAWAWKLKDRDDFELILDTDLDEYGTSGTFRDQVLCAIYFEAKLSDTFGSVHDSVGDGNNVDLELNTGETLEIDVDYVRNLSDLEGGLSDLEDMISRDMFEAVGIHWEDGYSRIREMIQEGGFPYFDTGLVTEVLAKRMRTRKKMEEAANLTEEAQAEIQQLEDSDDLDF